MNAANKRREKDIMKLMVSDFEVVMAETPSSSFASEFYVKFQGPKESPYEEVSRSAALVMSKLLIAVLQNVTWLNLFLCHP